MKSYLLILTIVALFFGCSKDDGKEVSKGMYAKVYGKDWNAVTYQANWIDKSIAISGIASDGSSIVINLNDTVEKDYPITYQTSLQQSSASYNPKDSVTYASTYNANVGGTVTITSLNKKDSTISGNFNLTLYRANSNKVTLTGGTFNHIPYKKGLTKVPGNTFSSKISGVDWSPITIGGTNSLGFLILNATDGQKTISLQVLSSTSTGSYDLTNNGIYSLSYIEGTNIYNSESGNVTITTRNTTTKRIEGNFNATVVNYVNSSLTYPPQQYHLLIQAIPMYF